MSAAGLALSDRELYRLYVHATVGVVSLADTANEQASKLEFSQHGELDWPDIASLWGDLGESSAVLHRLWTHLQDGGYLPRHLVPDDDEPSTDDEPTTDEVPATGDEPATEA